MISDVALPIEILNKIHEKTSVKITAPHPVRGHRYKMDPLAFEKFQNAVFFKIFKFPFNESLEMV